MKKISFILILLASIFAVTANAQERGYIVADFGFPGHLSDTDESERFYSDAGFYNPTFKQELISTTALRLAIGFYPTKDEKHAIEIGSTDLGQYKISGTASDVSFESTYDVHATEASYIGRFNTNGTFRVGYALLSIEEDGKDIEEFDFVTVNNGLLLGIGYEKNRLRFEYSFYSFSYDVEIADETYRLYNGAGFLSVGYKFNF